MSAPPAARILRGVPRRPPPTAVDEPALAAWRGLLRTHAAVLRELDAVLRDRHGISVNDYDVLLTLSRGPREGTRMTELAGRTLLSKSGLTGIVNRLQRAGLVARAPVPGDARGSLAVLTTRGGRLADDAHRTQTEVSRTVIGSRLGNDDAALLAGLLRRVESGAEGDHGTTVAVRSRTNNMAETASSTD